MNLHHFKRARALLWLAAALACTGCGLHNRSATAGSPGIADSAKAAASAPASPAPPGSPGAK
ncbi:hypothetical protein [Pseudorhodoferax sp. Leaf267]|uniref:hypothetical protein n=1 Tax=Pseudorhodoferax sp. Leaf267 TaxID=1736316 RepID=UPI0006F59F60|nr:hypothetical protein [Pseudorhodoferax sp. Leaf267]KQP22954.1 hypothetical protein ASF43_03415 [Pseudorhodoferax sp. Leaf267]